MIIATSLRRSPDLQANVIAFCDVFIAIVVGRHFVNSPPTFQRAEVARKSPFNYDIHYLHHPDKNDLTGLLYEFTCYFF